MATKLTNSSKRKTNAVSTKRYQQTVRQLNQLNQQGAYKVYSDKFIEASEKLDCVKTLNPEQKRGILANLVETGVIPLFDETYRELIENSSLGGFFFSIMASSNCAAEAENLFGSFPQVAEMTTVALGKGLKRNPSILDLKYARGALHQFGFHIASLAKERRLNQRMADSCFELAQSWGDAIDVQENIANDRIIYADEYLAITWYSACIEADRSFRSSGDVAIAVRRLNGVWTFDKYSDTQVPISSLRKARTACLGWKGQKMSGDLTHAESKRAAEFLGFKVVGNIAHLGTSGYGGFGQKNQKSNR